MVDELFRRIHTLTSGEHAGSQYEVEKTGWGVWVWVRVKGPPLFPPTPPYVPSKVRAQYVEVYNGRVYDLLGEAAARGRSS